MKIAQDIGLEIFIQKDGVPGLVKAMRDSVSVKRDLEAMQLYKEGSKAKGLLSRQMGESMQSYVLRRKRWWKRLRALDDKYSVSENILTDMLLYGSGVNTQEKLMILTSVGNQKIFEKVADAMLTHHPRLHEVETARPPANQFGSTNRWPS